MGWAHLLVALVAVQAITPLLIPRAAADDFLSPLLSPALDELCHHVDCGKGSCEASTNHSLGFVCNCQPGWSQLNVEDHLRFLPCIIPNCSINYSCYKDSAPPAPAPVPPPPSNISLLDPCLWSYCGGGSCVKTSDFEHRCECKEGFSNLLNVTSFPCYRDCSLGADCVSLGITLSNSTQSSSPSPNLSDSGSSSSGVICSPKSLLWLPILTISLIMARAT